MATELLHQPTNRSLEQFPLHLTGSALIFVHAKAKIDALSLEPGHVIINSSVVAINAHARRQLGSFTSPWSLNVIGKPSEPCHVRLDSRVKAYLDETETLDAGTCFMAIANTAAPRDQREIPEQVLTMIQKLRKFDKEWMDLQRDDKT